MHKTFTILFKSKWLFGRLTPVNYLTNQRTQKPYNIEPFLWKKINKKQQISIFKYQRCWCLHAGHKKTRAFSFRSASDQRNICRLLRMNHHKETAWTTQKPLTQENNIFTSFWLFWMRVHVFINTNVFFFNCFSFVNLKILPMFSFFLFYYSLEFGIFDITKLAGLNSYILCRIRPETEQEQLRSRLCDV